MLFMLAETLGRTIPELLATGMTSMEFTMWAMYLNTKADIKEASAAHPTWDGQTVVDYLRVSERLGG